MCGTPDNAIDPGGQYRDDEAIFPVLAYIEIKMRHALIALLINGSSKVEVKQYAHACAGNEQQAQAKNNTVFRT